MSTRPPFPRLIRSAHLLAGAALLGACGRQLSAVDPAGPQARRIGELGLFLTVVGSVVWILVVGFLFYAVWRGRRRTESAGGPEVERTMWRWTIGAVAVTTVILLVVLVYNFDTGRRLARFPDESALVVRVTGHQWWWQVDYQDPRYDRRFTTANEIHVPVGRKVRIEVQSGDVIHSFWVPALHGKLDLIPGYTGVTAFQADRAGVYRGRCAEFCGLQHAHMDVLVIAQAPAEFAAWYDAQVRGAAVPADSPQQKGQQVFLSRGCVMCHTVRGTPAGSRVGPDLTHVGSRRTLASGTLPNTRGHLAGWVVDPQRIKPGTQMPPNPLPSDELHALLSYLQSLK
ncbi:cytochrome c oxidase subunit II [Longimicrobium sp.]|uniref:cytochrome c oxidase subunit II n=1 Tax=Longimicrobium sp. TaxID=2029185 RepID=UPI002E305CAC|nr:cytochrome c oxidase subunit II [Longimicrobium sp.]HEX6042808.1 cytochrome c oxidase subunit II [Longimicrobium sp.]